MNGKVVMFITSLIVSMQAMPMAGLFLNKAAIHVKKIGYYIKNNPEKIALIAPAGFSGSLVAVSCINYFFPPDYYMDFDYDETIDEDTRKELQEIRLFVDKELVIGGLNPNEIKVRFYRFFDAYVGGKYEVRHDNILLLNKADFYDARLLKAPLEFKQNDELDDDEKVNRIRATIQHEISHLKNKDYLRASVMQSLFGVATFALFKKTCNFIPFKGIRAGVFLGGVLPLYGANRILNLWYARHREVIADESVPGSREYLTGAVILQKENAEREKLAIADGLLCDTKGIKGFVKYCWYYDHPTGESRLTRAKERLASLGQQEL